MTRRRKQIRFQSKTWVLLVGFLLLTISPTCAHPPNAMGVARPIGNTETKPAQKDLWHTVQRGETLWELSQHYHTNVKSIQKVNRLRSHRIQTGQKLLIQAVKGLWHTVRRGETLWDIATHYHTTMTSIKSANHLDKNRIRAGQKLFVPGATPPERGAGFWHQVKPGESIWGLAHKYRVPEQTLRNLNALVTGQLQVGQRLFIPKSEPKPSPKRATKTKRRSRQKRRATTPKFISPLAQKTVITDEYGPRVRHPVTGRPGFHHGVDLRAPVGTPVRASRAGTVAFAGWRGGFGRLVVIQHTGGFRTVYGHLKQIRVRVGQQVKSGKIIGLAGNSGRTTGPHLHFEIHDKGVSKNPQRYLRF